MECTFMLKFNFMILSLICEQGSKLRNISLSPRPPFYVHPLDPPLYFLYVFPCDSQ
jgi:hypothetical protein